MCLKPYKCNAAAVKIFSSINIMGFIESQMRNELESNNIFHASTHTLSAKMPFLNYYCALQITFLFNELSTYHSFNCERPKKGFNGHP